MKVSKKLLIPILIIVIACITVGVNFFSSKYPLSGVKSDDIKTVKVYHNKDSKFLKTYNTEGKKILSYLKKIDSKSSTDSDEAGFIADDFCLSLSNKSPKNYYVEVNFTKDVNLKIKDSVIKCDMLVIDISEKIIYYHDSKEFTLNKLNTSEADFSKLEKYLGSNF